MRILVTGAARAIGAATVAELAARGHDVVATARDVSGIDVPGIDATGNVSVLPLDVTNDASVLACLAEAGELDAIVNNAAIQGAGPLDQFPLDRLLQMFDTNAIGALRVVNGVLDHWRSRGSGVIVNVSSVQGQVATKLLGAYRHRSTRSKQFRKPCTTNSAISGSEP